MKLNALQSELAKIERRRADLQEKIGKEAKTLFSSLPAKVGLRTVDALILALAPFSSSSMRAKLNSAQKGTEKASETPIVTPRGTSARKGISKGKIRPRVRSVEQKSAVKAAFIEGKLTIREISNKYNVPFNTLKKWKKAWGLTTKARAKK